MCLLKACTLSFKAISCCLSTPICAFKFPKRSSYISVQACSRSMSFEPRSRRFFDALFDSRSDRLDFLFFLPCFDSLARFVSFDFFCSLACFVSFGRFCSFDFSGFRSFADCGSVFRFFGAMVSAWRSELARFVPASQLREWRLRSRLKPRCESRLESRLPCCE